MENIPCSYLSWDFLHPSLSLREEHNQHPHRARGTLSSFRPISQWLFWGIFVRKVFYTNLNLRYQKIKKISKNKGTFVTSTSKVDYLVATFFQISYSSVPKMRFVFDTFLQRFPKTAIVFGQMIWFMFWAVIKHVGYLCHNEVKLFYK